MAKVHIIRSRKSVAALRQRVYLDHVHKQRGKLVLTTLKGAKK